MTQPSLKQKVLGGLYRNVAKEIFFRLDPEDVHDRVSALGKMLGRYGWSRALTKGLFYFEHPSLKQTVAGIEFNNPIGLAAGFDKNAELTDILPSLGFGFVEVGSITGEPCPGNAKPRLWRLPQSNSLVVYYGLKNDGCEAIAKRLSGRKFAIPVGISVAKTNCADTVETAKGVADYVKAYTVMSGIGAYTTINISCPNAYGGQPFTDPSSLDLLLSQTDKVETSKPVFIKFSPDLSDAELDALLEVAGRHKVHGLVISNLTKNRDNSNIKENTVPEKGGLSGKVVESLANEMIAKVYGKTAGKFVIVGCGGVFTAEDAYKKIKLGANLIQMVTGVIFQGPQVVGEINRGLVQLLERDGYQNISQAVGTGL